METEKIKLSIDSKTESVSDAHVSSVQTHAYHGALREDEEENLSYPRKEN